MKIKLNYKLKVDIHIAYMHDITLLDNLFLRRSVIFSVATYQVKYVDNFTLHN